MPKTPAVEDMESLQEELRHRELPPIVQAVFAIASLAAVLLAINQLFNLNAFGVVLIDSQYLYVLSGLFMALTFLGFPAFKRQDRNRIPWYDIVLAAASFAVALYFTATSQRSLAEGWEFGAPETAQYLSFVFYLLVLEGTRRTGGMVVFAIVLLFSLYPIFADRMPGPISGFSQPLSETIVFHIVSAESALGIPVRAFGQLVVGFIVFGAALQFTGGAHFFNNLALALVGPYRGGAAKVAIFASGFMGSMSGSVVSNVLTTGVVSIPAMKKTGMSPHYAAGTEACASTGGTLMPPVMGTTAFVMASFVGLPYADIVVAAAIPSLLFYFSLFVQLDAYAARRGMRGLARVDVPKMRETFAQGWQYIPVFAVLIYMLVVRRQETLAPFYATALLLVINQIIPSTRLSLSGFAKLLVSVGRSLAELVALLLGVGMIVGAFSATGLAGTLVNDLVFLAGREVGPLLVMGAVTAFIFGMGMTVTACYIFLAIVLAPALTQLGLNVLAVHLFILYWGMVSFITPPVALGAFAAASIAGTTPMRAGFAAMRIGSIIYIVPFLFVANPALIGQGAPGEIAIVLLTALLGVFLIGSALQGYIAGCGTMRDGPAGLVSRVILFAGGLAFASPGGVAGRSNLELILIGLVLSLPVAADTYRRNRLVPGHDLAQAGKVD
ncbi:TRAP transporter permease [Paracoccus thiocyanatus]|nr:TRAP transporter fused permease subunit [Paracoccus thiocyanatus]